MIRSRIHNASGQIRALLQSGVLAVNVASLVVANGLTVTAGQSVFPAGTEAAPSVAIGETGKGFYEVSAGILAATTGGTARTRFSSSGLQTVGGMPVIASTGITMQGGNVIYSPAAVQNITAAATAISAASHKLISSDANYTMTGSGGVGATISDGSNGQIMRITNTGAFTVTLQDAGTYATSNLRLTAATVAIGPRQSIDLMFLTAVGDWVQTGNVVAVL